MTLPKRVNSANCSNLGYVAVIMYKGTDFSSGCNSSSTFFGHGFDLFRSCKGSWTSPIIDKLYILLLPMKFTMG